MGQVVQPVLAAGMVAVVPQARAPNALRGKLRASGRMRRTAHPFDVIAASPIAINFTAAQWGAFLKRKRAQWAAEDAGLAPRSTVCLPVRRDRMAEDNAEHMERFLGDAFYARGRM